MARHRDRGGWQVNIHVRFESKTGGYVPVLSNSTVATGKLVSQNAGSSNPGIYYQVGGGGLNGRFRDALGPEQTDRVNQALRAAYDGRFGAGAWMDQNQKGANAPLTSFLVPVDAARPGDQIVGMIYSVGPQLTKGAITDKSQYRAIYTDAFAAVVSANARGERIAAVRITMLSTGIYAGALSNPSALYDTSASCILDGIEQAAAAAAAAHFPQTVLVNSATEPDGSSKEVDSFTRAAKNRGLAVDAGGFDFTVKTLA
jgi:hypothetical protein